MAKKKSRIMEEISKEAIAIVDKERTNWEDAVCFVTEKVGFRMRELIRILRKNYWGVFDEPIDKQTGREKVWIGLIMSLIETWAKNGKLTQKDIGFIARRPEGYPITELTRLVVREDLDRQYFGEVLATDKRQALIDGTLVWKTWEENPTGKKVVAKRRTVDLLNFYIDPTEENVQTAYRVTERSILLPEQIKAMSGWTETDDLEGSQILAKDDGFRGSNFGTKTTGEFRDVWETWGKIPRWLITGDKKAKDAYEEVDGHIIVSGLEAGEPKCHLIEENTKKDKYGNVLKPYEEFRVAKIAGRWYGLGIAERALALQEYLNTIINIRINRGYVSQLGLFKIKKGKGITAQMLNKLPVNGAVQVTDMDDIQQMAVSEVGQSSYNDEDVIKYWAQQVTSAQPVSNGEILPASATATSAAIANTNSKSAYVQFDEGFGSFIERWLDRHYVPIIAKTVKKGDILRVMGDDEKFKELVENIALNTVLEEMENSPVVPSQAELAEAIEEETERLLKSGQVFVEAVQDIIAEMLDTRAKITNEDLDTSVTIANLLQMMQIPAEQKSDEEVRMVYDLMGLQAPKKKIMPQPMPGAQPADPGAAPSQTDIMSSSLLKGVVA